ncbi:FGGY family carbohydrate kinase [Nostoc sp. PCC 7524]|uniref:FGGY family carbohydrate kinase n=1 Tax=Nostoc sp. (strain ATCC 29411 / PCC 7524) TaxID=28072 RepID=UPI0005A00726|nr:FGGY family carbohydrate kinase [Nostoc sp. PCC 7524]
MAKVSYLTGGTEGGLHITYVTNASRTLLMNWNTLDWEGEILEIMGIPRQMLPEIHPSSAIYGKATGSLAGVVHKFTLFINLHTA